MLAFLGVIVPGSLGIYVPTYPQVREGREGGREEGKKRTGRNGRYDSSLTHALIAFSI
jgi:hypothetical protein